MSEAKVVLTKYLCIMVSGKAGVGKSTFSNFAVEHARKFYGLEHANVFNFAYGVKDVAKRCFGWDGKKDNAGRVLLQDVGRTGRAYDINIWVKRLLEKFYGTEHYSDLFLIDDWRFPNEGQYIEVHEPSFQVIHVRIESPERECLKGTEAYNDVSETSLPGVEIDYVGYPYYATDNEVPCYEYVVANTGKLEDLKLIAEAIVDREINKLVFA